MTKLAAKGERAPENERAFVRTRLDKLAAEIANLQDEMRKVREELQKRQV